MRFPRSRRPLAPTLALTLATGLLLLAAVAAPAEEPSEDFTPLLVERITVEGAPEAASRIIAAETLLVEGVWYTAADLSQAVARVHRLSFVLDAGFELRPGNRTGGHELVVTAHTDRWFSFERGLGLQRSDRTYAFTDPSDDDTLTSSQTGVIGGRLFVGRAGVLHGRLGYRDDLQDESILRAGGGYEIAYTQHDLFGRGITASASYTSRDCCATEVLPIGLAPELTAWDWDGSEVLATSLSMPLSLHRSFQLGWTEQRGRADDRRRVLEPFGGLDRDFVFDGDQASRRIAARWVQDTSDDPLLPSRGAVLSAGLKYAAYEASDLRAFRFLGRGEQPEVVEPLPFAGEHLAAVFAATRHWSLTGRQSVSAKGRFSVGRSRVTNLEIDGVVLPETELDVAGGSVGAAHLLRLWTRRSPGSANDLWLETGASFGVEGVSPDLGLPDDPLERLELSTALTFRSSWGRVKLGLSYLDLGGDRP